LRLFFKEICPKRWPKKGRTKKGGSKKWKIFSSISIPIVHGSRADEGVHQTDQSSGRNMASSETHGFGRPSLHHVVFLAFDVKPFHQPLRKEKK